MSRLIVTNVETQNIKFDSDTTAFSINSSGVLNTSSIIVKGEGTAITNLQQGLAKAWVLFNGTGTIASTDSFNISGLTDNGTGNYTIVIDNNMNVSNGFSCVGSDEDRGVGETDPSGTGGVTCVRRNTSATAQDCAQISVTVHGDLA